MPVNFKKDLGKNKIRTDLITHRDNKVVHRRTRPPTSHPGPDPAQKAHPVLPGACRPVISLFLVTQLMTRRGPHFSLRPPGPGR